MLLVLLAAVSLASSGCGGNGGSPTAVESTDKLKTGKAMEKGDDDQEGPWGWDPSAVFVELGTPVYPGAQYVEGTGWSMTQRDDAAAEFTSNDFFSEVVAWYTALFGEPEEYNKDDKASWSSATMEDGSLVSAVITLDKGRTRIFLIHVAAVVDEGEGHEHEHCEH